MADWYGTARTNYVRIIDAEGLKHALDYFDVSVLDGKLADIKDGDVVGFTPGHMSGSGGFSDCLREIDEDDENAVEHFGPRIEAGIVVFDFAEDVMPFVAPGDVLVVMEAGAEKLRYITGCAVAYVRNEQGEVGIASIDLNDIYALAADRFKSYVPEQKELQISPCEY